MTHPTHIKNKTHVEQVCRLWWRQLCLSTGAVIHPVLWVVPFPKQTRQWLHRAGRVQRRSKVSASNHILGKHHIQQVHFFIWKEPSRLTCMRTYTILSVITFPQLPASPQGSGVSQPPSQNHSVTPPAPAPSEACLFRARPGDPSREGLWLLRRRR